MTTLAVAAAGRRRYVVEGLLAAAGPHDTVIAIDRDGSAPALSVSGAVPVVQRDGEQSSLKEALVHHQVDAVISLHDYQTVELARASHELSASGIRFIGPDLNSALILLDKLALVQHLTTVAPELAVPTFPASEMPAPLGERWILKDRYGSGSSGLHIVDNSDDAHLAATTRRRSHGWNPESELRPIEIIAQPFIDGQEYNIDVFMDDRGKIRGHCIKRKLSMRDGETDAATIVLHDQLQLVGKIREALTDLRVMGNLDVDAIVHRGGVRILDINPRFGGGYAFSRLADYDAARGIWSLARREAVDTYFEPSRELSASKYVAVAEFRS